MCIMNVVKTAMSSRGWTRIRERFAGQRLYSLGTAREHGFGVGTYKVRAQYVN